MTPKANDSEANDAEGISTLNEILKLSIFKNEKI
jgi:hypothetical protein